MRSASPLIDRPSRKRVGFTLFELILTMGVSVVILALVAASLRQAVQADVSMRSNSEWMNVAGRLSDQLRNDVRNAENASLRGNNVTADRLNTELWLTFEGKQVSYVVATKSIERTVWEGSDMKSRDGYSLPKDAQVEWGVDLPDADSRFVRMRVRNIKVKTNEKPTLLEVVGQLGKYRSNIRSKETSDEA